MVLLLVLVTMAACTADHDEGGKGTALVNVGDLVPSFSLSGSDGHDISSTSLEGKAYILNFFDTRCPDCQQEFQVLQQIYDKYHETVPILNVPRSETKDEVQNYWVKAGLTMPYYIPSDSRLYYEFATKTIPRTYVIDRNGKVLATFTDSPVADYESLDNLLKSLVGDPSDEEGTVSLSMHLKVPVRGSTIDQYYFQNEYIISLLEVYFFHADTKKFFTKKVATNLVQEESAQDVRYDITYLFEDVRIKADAYDIFIVANNYNTLEDVEDEEEFLNRIDSVTYKEGIEANMPETGPVMTNRATSLLNVDLVPWVNKHYTLSVEVERVVAKVEIGVAQNTFQLKHNQRKYAEINLTNYKLVNLNTQYYLFQHRDALTELGEQPKFEMPYHFSDYSDVGEQYVVDPLFYKKTLNPSDAASFDQYYQSWYGNFTTENFASMPPAGNHGYAYILENTTFKTSQKNGYSSGIIFKGAVSPEVVYLYDVNQRTLKEERRPEYWPKSIYLYNYNFYGSIQAINADSNLALDELTTYSDTDLKRWGIKQCKFNMGVYETYYTYWIRHRNNPSNPMGAMEYGILRNNFYRMTVTGINGIGHSEITPEIMRDNYPNSYVDVFVE